MEFTNSKGVKWYLHKAKRIIGRNKVAVDTYFFKKEKGESFCDLPSRYKVIETSSGLPIIKRI